MQVLNPTNQRFVIQHGAHPDSTDQSIWSRTFRNDLDSAMDTFADFTRHMPNGGCVELFDTKENRVVGSVYL